MVWLQYLACLAVILFAGTRLARYADAIADKTGLGHIWVGLLFVGIITSSPELVTAVSSAALLGQPDLGVGALIGTCPFNLFLLALLDILYPRMPLLTRASRRHIISAVMGIALLSFAAGAIWAGPRLAGFAVGGVGLTSLVLALIYAFGLREIFRYEYRNRLKLPKPPPEEKRVPVSRLWLKFALAALAIIGAGIWLSFIGDEIARSTGLGASFVGSLFLAITTSMPELVVGVSAVRLGAIDLAFADILGANMLDIANLFIVNLFYREGPILSNASSTHLITVATGIAMNLVVIAGLRFQTKREPLKIVSWSTPILMVLYLLGAYFLFIFSRTSP